HVVGVATRLEEAPVTLHGGRCVLGILRSPDEQHRLGLGARKELCSHRGEGGGAGRRGLGEGGLDALGARPPRPLLFERLGAERQRRHLDDRGLGGAERRHRRRWSGAYLGVLPGEDSGPNGDEERYGNDQSMTQTGWTSDL